MTSRPASVDDLVLLDALGPEGSYRTRARETVRDVAGQPVAEMSLVPRLYIARALAAQRKSPSLPAVDSGRALPRAAELFMSESLGGLTFSDYVELTSRVAGLPIAVARDGAVAAADGLRTAVDGVRPARPSGAVADWRAAPAAGSAVWARRGTVLAVHAPGNAPGVHGLWPQALALGYRVAVRPSRREPFTAHRMMLALRTSGFRDVDALYLPTDHTVASDLIAGADLSLAYGGRDVVDRYRDDTTVLTNGPGQTKILVTADQDWRDHLDIIVDSVASLGGTACVNTTAVLAERDAEPLARALGERLAVLAPLPITDPGAVLPVVSAQRARDLAAYVATKAAGTVPILGADQIVGDLGGGFAALRPAVHLLSKPDVEVLNVELPFPCVWVAPWSRAGGVGALRDSLVIAAITDDDELVDQLLDEPSIANVFVGAVPTHRFAAHVPHEGFLADFLMRNKGHHRVRKGGLEPPRPKTLEPKSSASTNSATRA